VASYEFVVSLRLTLVTRNIHPQEISDRLKLNPKWQWVIGEPRVTPKGDRLSGVYKNSYCVFDLDKREGDTLSETINRAMDEFARNRELFHRIFADGGKAECFVGWFFVGNSGDTFDASLLGKLADMKVDLAFDIYDRPRFGATPSSAEVI